MKRQHSFKMSQLERSPRGILISSRSLNNMKPLRRCMQKQREASDALDKLFQWEQSSIEYVNFIKTEYHSTVWTNQFEEGERKISSPTIGQSLSKLIIMKWNTMTSAPYIK